MASTNAFSKYKALVFDCYGTLVDWESGIYDSLKPLFEKSGKPSDKHAVIEAFSSVERDLQARFPTLRYSDLLARVYTTLDARLQNEPTPPEALRDDISVGQPVVASTHTTTGASQIASAPVGTSASASEGEATPSAAAAAAFAQSVPEWPPFPDTIPALGTLSRRFKLVILSNIDRATIAQTCARLEGGGAFAFDAVYTAEEVGAYKPAPEMLAYALRRLREDFGIVQEEVLMTAQSVFHDIAPARSRGIDTAWINRADAVTGLPDGGATQDVAKFVFSTLGELAEVVDKECAT